MISTPSKRFVPRAAGVLAGAVAGLLVAAPAALATTIRYELPPSPAYEQKTEDKTLKVEYTACVPAGEVLTLQLHVTSRRFADTGPGNFVTTYEDGQQPSVTLTPAAVQITRESEQAYDVTLTFALPAESAERTTFRVKLVPASGQGVEGLSGGVRVRVPCVSAARVTAGPTGPVAPAPAPQPPAVLPAFAESCPAQGRLRMRVRSLRAGELATIRVSLPDLPGTTEAGSAVRATGPGVRVKRLADENGRVVLRVRPTRAGTVVVQSDCARGSRRIRVLGRRSASARGLPRFTG